MFTGVDPTVHRDGRGPSSADLTGEGKDEEPMETEKPQEPEVPAEDKEHKEKVCVCVCACSLGWFIYLFGRGSCGKGVG